MCIRHFMKRLNWRCVSKRNAAKEVQRREKQKSKVFYLQRLPFAHFRKGLQLSQVQHHKGFRGHQNDRFTIFHISRVVTWLDIIWLFKGIVFIHYVAA